MTGDQRPERERWSLPAWTPLGSPLAGGAANIAVFLSSPPHALRTDGMGGRLRVSVAKSTSRPAQARDTSSTPAQHAPWSTGRWTR